MENAGYLLAAFTAVWTVVFGYVLVLFRRQSRLQRDIERLKEALREKEVKQ